jgi:hypothetical protein
MDRQFWDKHLQDAAEQVASTARDLKTAKDEVARKHFEKQHADAKAARAEKLHQEALTKQEQFRAAKEAFEQKGLCFRLIFTL